MAYYDEQAHCFRDSFTPGLVDGSPGWIVFDCGCCAGIKWGGYEPRDCDSCGGGGSLYLHVKSHRLAQWPGGPFAGVASPDDAARLVDAVGGLAA